MLIPILGQVAAEALAAFNNATPKKPSRFLAEGRILSVTFRYHKQLKAKEHMALGRKSDFALCSWRTTAQQEGPCSASRSFPNGLREGSPQVGPSASKDCQCSSLHREVLLLVLLKGSIKTIILHAAFPLVCIMQEQRSPHAPTVAAVPTTAHFSSRPHSPAPFYLLGKTPPACYTCKYLLKTST